MRALTFFSFHFAHLFMSRSQWWEFMQGMPISPVPGQLQQEDDRKCNPSECLGSSPGTLSAWTWGGGHPGPKSTQLARLDTKEQRLSEPLPHLWALPPLIPVCSHICEMILFQSVSETLYFDLFHGLCVKDMKRLNATIKSPSLECCRGTWASFRRNRWITCSIMM